MRHDELLTIAPADDDSIAWIADTDLEFRNLLLKFTKTLKTKIID